MNNKNLPSKWIKTTLGEVFTWMSGGTPARSNSSYYGGNIPWVTITDLNDGLVINTHNYLTDIAIENSSAKLIPANSVMIGLYGSIGKLGIAGRELTTNQAIASAIPNFKEFNSKFLFYYLAYSKQNLAKLGSGVTQKNIYISNLKEYEFYLPPFQEQIRIADKVDELFSELDNGIEELVTAQKKLKLYRQSLLKSAVEGQLSKEWRETQVEVSETGEQLLTRILKERRERWEQEQLREFSEKGKNPPKNWQDKYSEPVQPDTENLPQLPEGWVWASLDQVMLIKGGIQKKPSRAPVNNKFPFLRVANVYRAQLNLGDIHEIELFEGEIDRYKLETGDLLIVEGNGSLTEIGRCAIWDGSIPNAVHQNHLIRARPIHVLSQYLETWLNSSDGINYMAKLAVTTSGLYSLSVGKIAQIPVPLPPLNEQAFITIDLASKIEQQSQQLTNLEELQKLNQLQKKNILLDAFTGKLVTQDPNDEPAQVLLERIQQQREAEALTKKATPKKRSTPKAKKEVGMSQNILEILQQQSDWISGQELAELFGINTSSDITDIETFYHELKILTLQEKIAVKPDNDLFKNQDLFKYLG